MSIRAQNTSLNIIPGGIIPVVNVSQYDVNRTLTFTIMDGNTPASIDSGTSVTIEGTKPSKKGFMYTSAGVISISGNTVTVQTQDQMTVEKGTVECKIKLKQGSQTIGTALFLMEVEQAGLEDGTDISETVLPEYMEAGHQYMLGAEAWAVGTKNGVPVPSTEPQYQNSAKFWKDQTQGVVDQAHAYANEAKTYKNQSDVNAALSLQYANRAAASAEDGRIWAKSWAVYSDNPDTFGHDRNNSQYWCDRAKYWQEKTSELYRAMQEKIDSMMVILHMLIGDIHLMTDSGDGLITQSGDMLTISFGETARLVTENLDEILSQRGNSIAVSR